MDKEDSCRDKKDSVKSSLPLHHIVAKPQSCIGEQCAPALCRGFFMYTGVHECTRHFRHKNAPNCENSGRFVYIFVYTFRKPLTLNVYCGETGTCRPFERKLFLTVRGKILPCEKIGQEHAIGYLKDGKLNLDCAAVAKYYSSMYEKVVKSCRHCYLKRSCGQCLFLLKEKNGQLICPGIQTDAKLKEEFGIFLTYAENYPNHYEELLSSIVVD